MIELVESIAPVQLFLLPEPLGGRTQFLATFQPDVTVIDALKTAFGAILQELKVSPALPERLFTNVIIYDRERLTFHFDDTKTLGNHVNLVLLPVHRWAAANCNYQQVVTCILEELCHCYWGIVDETAVKHKVVAVARHINSSITIEDLYPGMFPPVSTDPKS